jgi:hypothetical protein
MAGLDEGAGRHQWIPRNQPPVIEINTTLLVDDDATESLLGHLRATDRESGPGDLTFRISQGPANGALFIAGREVDAPKVAFTPAELDSGRITFRFDPHAQNKILAIEGDTFVFTVTDGTHITGPATFRIHNSTVQVWGTDDSDDLTGAPISAARERSSTSTASTATTPCAAGPVRTPWTAAGMTMPPPVCSPRRAATPRTTARAPRPWTST